MTYINDKDFMGAAAGMSLDMCGPVTISVMAFSPLFKRLQNLIVNS